MKKVLVVSALVASSALMSGLAAAQEVGKVISSTPVLKRVTEPKSTCTNDAEGKQRCTTQMVTEDRTIGYKVVYEYAGRQHTAQLPFAPGATIPIEVNVAPQGAPVRSVPPINTVYAPEPRTIYVTESPVVETVYRDRVYVESPYYDSRPYYYGSSYYNPLYPVLGLGLGYAAGYYAGGYRGGYRHFGHWRR
ncbi:MAG: hypothetical protein ABI583_05890 [Betaproteobacteria bacterium]